MSLLEVQGKKPSKMLMDLGLSTSTIAELGVRRGIPSIDRIYKLASYLNVSVDYLFGIYPPGKDPYDIAREVYLAMSKEDRKSALQRVIALDETDPQKVVEKPKCRSGYNNLKCLIDDLKNELDTSLGELGTMQNELSEKLKAISSAPDQREIVMAQFLALPRHLQKIFLQEAVEITSDSQF
jgi:transcriptional regulator with XRE-family HTH domain